MTKKIRTNLTPPALFEAMLASPSVLGPNLVPPQERLPQRHAKQSFSVHQRIAPQRITSFANRRRNK